MTIKQKTAEKTKKTKSTKRGSTLQPKQQQGKKGKDNSTRGKEFRQKKQESWKQLQDDHQKLIEWFATYMPDLLPTVTPSLFDPQPISSKSLKNELSKNLETFVQLYRQYIEKEELNHEDKGYKWFKMIKERENRALKKQKEDNLKARISCLWDLYFRYSDTLSPNATQPVSSNFDTTLLDEDFDSDVSFSFLDDPALAGFDEIHSI
jgi:hypothetical protein